MYGGLQSLQSLWQARPLPVKHVLIVNGHPDPGPARFCSALCAAYTEGAQASGHKTRRLDMGAVRFPGAVSEHQSWLQNDGAKVLERLWLADRLFIAFPMWLGGAPPVLKLILEEFARWQDAEAVALGVPLEEKDAHIVMTAGFPSFVYSTNRGIPVGAWASSFSGLHTTKVVVIGNMDLISAEDRSHWLGEVRRLGSSRL